MSSGGGGGCPSAGGKTWVFVYGALALLMLFLNGADLWHFLFMVPFLCFFFLRCLLMAFFCYSCCGALGLLMVLLMLFFFFGSGFYERLDGFEGGCSGGLMNEFTFFLEVWEVWDLCILQLFFPSLKRLKTFFVVS